MPMAARRRATRGTRRLCGRHTGASYYAIPSHLSTRALDRVDSAWYGTPRSSRPPSLVCSLGGVITNTVQDRGARCRSSVVPPLPDGDGGVTDRATRGACSAGSGVVRCTTSLGLRSPYDASRHRLGFVWSRTTPGWASPSIFVSYSFPFFVFVPFLFSKVYAGQLALDPVPRSGELAQLVRIFRASTQHLEHLTLAFSLFSPPSGAPAPGGPWT